MSSEAVSNEWGFVPPADEEVTAALEWHSAERSEMLNRVLARCMTEAQFAHMFSISVDQAQVATQNGSVIAVDLGEAGRYFPDWQFDMAEKEQGRIAIRSEIGYLRHVWNYGNLEFCDYMTRAGSADSRSPLEVIIQSDSIAFGKIQQQASRNPEYM